MTDSIVVNHSGDISADETWVGDGVMHVVPFDISIRNRATVTIEPCAVVALGYRASITVRDSATLVSAGTDSQHFVSFRRADVLQPWGALFNRSPTSLIDLSYTVLQGGGDLRGSYDNAGIVVSGAGYFEPPVPVLRASDLTIDSPLGAGLYLDANAAFTADSRQISIRGAGEYAVRATMMSLGSLPEGSYRGNAIDEIMVIGPSADVFADMTILDRGVPVRIQTSGLRVAARPPATAPVTLTIEPGVVLKFPRMTPTQPGARLTFGYDGRAPTNTVGVLDAVGTSAKPIVFTSGELLPSPGDWVGLWLNTANGSRLKHVEIAYAGAPSGISSNNCRPANTPDAAALFVGDFDTQYVPPPDLITNSWIHHSAGFGIAALWASPLYNDPDLTGTNRFESNAFCRQTYNAVTAPGGCPKVLGCTAG
ncbi:MAG: hypothetical protein R3E10_14880 [Gemmatimonadota bacterium]